MKITKAEDYAVTLVSALARNFSQGPVSLRTIARKQRLPQLFLKKIARQLKAAGLLSVREGRGGGYSLNKSPDQLSLKEVLRVFNPQPLVTSCLDWDHKIKCGIYNTCTTRRTWEAVSRSFYDNLQHITFGELIKKS